MAKRHGVPLLIILAAALAPAAGCRKASRPPSSIRIAHESEVLSLDPATVSEVATISVLGNLYEGLVAFDKDMAIVPALAVSWNSVDEHTWIFQLRKGVRFHDGRALGPSDVKFSLERARSDPASAVKGFLSTLRTIEVDGATAVRLTTLKPDPLLLNRLTYVFIIPSGPQDFLNHPVGTGPYKFLRWERGAFLEAVAFSEHWNGKPAIDRARFITVEEGGRCIEAFKAGEVDVLRWVPEDMADRLSSVPNVHVVAREGLSAYYLWFNSEPRAQPPRNPFADRRVRQAISLAIDRRDLLARVGARGVPANQLVHNGVFGYVASLPELPFDPERARKLLRDAGYAAGLDTTLHHRPATSMSLVGGIVRAGLERVGVHVTVEPMDWPEMLDRWTAGRLPFFLAGWRFDAGDAASFLRDCLLTRDPAHHSGGYNPGYSNPELDRLIDENDQILDRSKRLHHYEALMRSTLDQMPLVPLFIRHQLFGVSTRLRWQPRLDGSLFAAEMSVAEP